MRKKLLLRLLIILLFIIFVSLVLFWLNSKRKASSKIEMFSGKIPNVGDTFYLTHPREDNISQTEVISQEGYGIPNNKYKVVSVDEDYITIEFIEEQGLNMKYYQVEPPKLLKIQNKGCMVINPLVTDTYQEVCFFVDKRLNPIEWKYKIFGGSTMPKPPLFF